MDNQTQVMENMELIINKGINNMVSRMSDHIISRLSDKYGFDKEEALRVVYTDNENNEKMNENNEKMNENNEKINENEDIIIESNNKPMTIEELQVPTETPHETPPEPVVEAPKKKGRPKKIPSTDTKTVAPKKKGRPKKNAVPDTVPEVPDVVPETQTTEQTPVVTETPKKKRGRPKKDNTQKENAIVSDDYENNTPPVVTNLLNAVRGGQISPNNATNSIHNYYTESTITENENTNETDETDETEAHETAADETADETAADETEGEKEDPDEINEEEYAKNVTSIIIHGTEYYIDDDNKLYDPDTTELIGKYNRDNDSVVN